MAFVLSLLRGLYLRPPPLLSVLFLVSRVSRFRFVSPPPPSAGTAAAAATAVPAPVPAAVPTAPSPAAGIPPAAGPVRASGGQRDGELSPFFSGLDLLLLFLLVWLATA